MEEELNYYIESLIKLSYAASAIKNKDNYNDSQYLHNEYNKLVVKINTFKYKILKRFKDLLLTIN